MTQASYKDKVPLQVADLIAWECTKDSLGKRPWPSFLRLRRAPGKFKIGNPPNMFEDWGPPPIHVLRELVEMNDDDE